MFNICPQNDFGLQVSPETSEMITGMDVQDSGISEIMENHYQVNEVHFTETLKSMSRYMYVILFINVFMKKFYYMQYTHICNCDSFAIILASIGFKRYYFHTIVPQQQVWN